MSKRLINLFDYKSNTYSALGNDGIIKYIFDTIGLKKGLFVEFGAWDGIYISNCRNLFKDGWDGIFIEIDKKKYKELRRNYKKHKNIVCLCQEIGIDDKNNFDEVIDPYASDKNIDFCSIDIDGLDVEVFETIDKHLPTVVCIESGFILPPYYERVEKSIAENNVHQSLYVTNQVFEQKGYKILCAGVNCFFIKEEYYHLFNVPKDLLTLYFDGLRSSIRRIPSIWRKLKHVDGLMKYRNHIAIDIMDMAGYNLDKDTVRNRKIWAKKKKDIIMSAIDELENREKLLIT
jgi:hypothetical protein